MSINYISHKELFDLKDNYTKEDLKKSFLNKIYNVDKLNISNTEKKILMENYNSQYKKAKANLIKGNIAGVIGVGEVGKLVVKRLEAAGFEVICFDPLKEKLNSLFLALLINH